MIVFVSGGCKNGKSSFAQELSLRLAAGGKRYYVATMVPCDEEDRERVRRHLENRAGMGFETIERARGLMDGIRGADRDGTFLVDSVTALLLNEMFQDAHGGEADPAAERRCREETLALARSVRNAVFVSDYIYSDAALYDAFTEGYRKALAGVDRALAEAADCVVELCAGVPHVHKGVLP